MSTRGRPPASTSHLITGALLIQSATRQAGRLITLVGAPDMAGSRVPPRSSSCVRGRRFRWRHATGRFELSFTDGCSFTVAFRQQETAIERNPCWASRRDPARLLPPDPSILEI